MKLVQISEITNSLKRNKLRTFLTGFSIAWGIFMLIILLAAGNGLKNGVTSNFADMSNNKLQLFASFTSMPYDGYPKGRRIDMNRNDSIFLANSFPEIDQVYALYDLGYKTVYNKKKYISTGIKALEPAYFEMNRLKITDGRTINRIDIVENRKVIVLNEKDAKLLFGVMSAVNRIVTLDNLSYTVVGVYSNQRSSWRSEAYVPLSTAQSIYNTSHTIQQIICSIQGLYTVEANDAFNDKIQLRLSKKHAYHPEDRNAISIWNSMSDYLETVNIFGAISMFVWIIGIGTLIAGIVGVSNIMLITVRERTKEFGIRKALGAKPSSIIRLIISESLLVTASFGYIGMFLGIAVTEGVNKILIHSTTSGGEENMPVIFQNPTIDLRIAIMATLVLIIAGVLAGYFPARKAVAIKPVEALKYE